VSDAGAPALVVFGEALIDFKSAGGLAFQGYVGGSPLNVAVAAARLGAVSALATRVSRDMFGEAIAAHLSANGVSDVLLQRGDEPATLAFVQLVRGDAHYSFRNEGAADTRYDPGSLVLPASVRAVHFGSVSLLYEPGASAIVRAVRALGGRALVHLDPNIRASLVKDRPAYLKRLDEAIALCDILKLSRDDLEWLAPGGGEEVAVMAWLEREPGPVAVVVTDAERGARLYRRGGEGLRVPAPTVSVVDTVGAGDTFSGATIAALLGKGVDGRQALVDLTTDSLGEVLTFAVAAAAINCTRAGCNPPGREQVLASLRS
jgi:fructokinase